MNKKLFEKFKEYHNANYHDGDDTFDFRTYKMSNGEDLDDDFVASCYEHFEYAWNQQQKVIDENNRVLKQFYYTCDGWTILKVNEALYRLEK